MSVAPRYLLDTNILSELINRGRTSPAYAWVEQAGQRICTSVIVASEIRYGVAKKGSALLEERAEAVLRSLPILDLAEPVDRHYADIRSSLERAGTPIGANDLFIAAQCRAMGAILVTANVSEFRRVPDLTVENWLEPSPAS